MSYLPGLRASLVEAARRQQDAGEEARPRHAVRARGVLVRERRILLVSVLLILAMTAVALAATGFFAAGTPVGPEAAPIPTANDGAAIPTSIKLLPIKVSDPRGGPAWGMRTVQTTRGESCVQFGRIGYGTVGVLGQDGAFGNDGRFHPLSPNYRDFLSCAVTDAHRNAFLNVGLSGFPASGLFPVTSRAAGGCQLTNGTRVPGRPACPPDDLRDIYFGLLGPDAVSVTYRGRSGHVVTVPTTGADGAYLIVLPHRAHAQEGTATVGPGLGGAPIQAVTYDDGHTCRTSVLHSCPPVGFVSPRTQRVSSRAVASLVTATTVPAKSYCAAVRGDRIRPCGAHPPHGFNRIYGSQGVLINVKFLARVAVTSSRSYYEVDFSYPKSRSCTIGATSAPTATDIRAGQQITMQTLSGPPKRCCRSQYP